MNKMQKVYCLAIYTFKDKEHTELLDAEMYVFKSLSEAHCKLGKMMIGKVRNATGVSLFGDIDQDIRQQISSDEGLQSWEYDTTKIEMEV